MHALQHNSTSGARCCTCCYCAARPFVLGCERSQLRLVVLKYLLVDITSHLTNYIYSIGPTINNKLCKQETHHSMIGYTTRNENFLENSLKTLLSILQQCIASHDKHDWWFFDNDFLLLYCHHFVLKADNDLVWQTYRFAFLAATFPNRIDPDILTILHTVSPNIVYYIN